jgi:DNA-binding response OmpR family regulator
MTNHKRNHNVTGNGKVRAPHVLVINDTQEILELFRDILEEEGFQVSLYSHTFRDIDEIAEIRPDLVILDFLIGGEAQGWQLLQKMKMSRKTDRLPIIVCTAAVQMARELEGHLTAKGVALVLKPFDIDDLLEAVRLAVSQSPRLADPAT